jgi:hypothetical protein
LTFFLSGQPARRYPAFLLAIVIVVVLISTSLFLTIGQASKSRTASTTSGTATVNTSTVTVNGSQYYADNVTKIMNTQGTTFHFNNGSVTFLGVEFQTICTDYSSRCPGVPPPPANTTYTLPSGSGITLNVTFPDHNSERIAFPILVHYLYAFSNHTNPRAGILFVYANSGSGIKSYLLVSTSISSTSSGAGVSSNTVVATVTVTETLTTQASQATTIYAIPTTNCTFSPVVTTTITTIIVGPTHPASTTTTTVTTTSTSYTQTVTVTSCTYSMPTVTSTVTTTVNP